MTITELTTENFGDNIAALKTALDGITGYFTSTEIDDTGDYPVMKCYAGESLACAFHITSGGGYFGLNLVVYGTRRLDYYTNGSSAINNGMIGRVMQTDSAIVLFISTDYERPIIIAKNRDGNLCFVFLLNDSSVISGISDGNRVVCATAGGAESVLPVVFGTDEEALTVYGNSIYNLSGVVKDVYVSTKSCYRTQTVPFAFAFGGTGYVGVRGNAFFVKSN